MIRAIGLMGRSLGAGVMALAAIGLMPTKPVVAAAIFFDGVVTETRDATPGMVLPPFATPGSILLTIDDTNPLQPLFDNFGDVAVDIQIVLDVPGFLSGGFSSPFSDPVSIESTYVSFASYGPVSFVTPGSSVLLPDGLQVFRANFGATLSNPLTATVGQLVAVLSQPTVHGYYGHQGESEDGMFPTTRVTFPVPLPLGIWLSLTGVAALVGMRLRSITVL